MDTQGSDPGALLRPDTSFAFAEAPSGGVDFRLVRLVSWRIHADEIRSSCSVLMIPFRNAHFPTEITVFRMRGKWAILLEEWEGANINCYLSRILQRNHISLDATKKTFILPGAPRTSREGAHAKV